MNPNDPQQYPYPPAGPSTTSSGSSGGQPPVPPQGQVPSVPSYAPAPSVMEPVLPPAPQAPLTPAYPQAPQPQQTPPAAPNLPPNIPQQPPTSEQELPPPLAPTPTGPSKNPGIERAATHARKAVKALVSIVFFVGLIWGAAGLLNAYVFQAYFVEGQSMEPALHSNDRLIISKVERTAALLNKQPYVPERGHIVIIDSGASAFTAARSEQIIKRVIGLPGDRVVIDNGRVTVYDKQHPNGFNADTELGLNVEPTYATEPIDIIVPDNHVYVLGDNRIEGASYDSRAVGPISTEYLHGRLWIRILPFNQSRIF